MYDYTVDYGLSWRDCPFYKITKNGVVVADWQIGDEAAAINAINLMIVADKAIKVEAEAEA